MECCAWLFQIEYSGAGSNVRQRRQTLVKTDVADLENAREPNNDQVDGNNIIEQFWLNQNEYTGK